MSPVLLPVLLSLAGAGCDSWDAMRQCHPACEKVFAEDRCALVVSTTPDSAVTACSAQCADLPLAERDEWIWCVAGASCEELEEGRCASADLLGR